MANKKSFKEKKGYDTPNGLFGGVIVYFSLAAGLSICTAGGWWIVLGLVICAVGVVIGLNI